MLYILILWLVYKLCKRISAHCKRYPYLPEQTPETVYTVNIADYLPKSIPKDDQPLDNPAIDFAKMEVERLQALKQEYMQVLDNIEQEQADLQAEYKQASVKRKSAISAKLTSLARQHASTTKTLQGIDAKIEKQYYKINVGG